MKRTYSIPAPPDKEYWYLTQAGALLIVNGAVSEPDTGVVQISSVVLFLGESLLNSIPEISASPKNFTLNQNYPNPFNPSTIINWQLAVGSMVELSVYNVLGEKVATVISERMNPGNHFYQFDGKNLASGVYYYQLVAGDYQEVKKMILLK
jgi:hypothetical protein